MLRDGVPAALVAAEAEGGSSGSRIATAESTTGSQDSIQAALEAARHRRPDAASRRLPEAA